MLVSVTTYAALARYERAILDFDESIGLNPISPLAFSNRCFARGSLNQFEQALADCSKTRRLAAIADYNLKLRATPDDAYALFGSASR